MNDFQFKTTPFAHQAELFELTKDLPGYAIFWEMGCGKTKVTLDQFAYLVEKGEVDALLVLSPKGVHTNWINDEIPVHLPERIMADSFGMMAWNTSKSRTKTHQKEFRDVMRCKTSVISMSYDSLMTKPGLEAAQAILKKRRCFYVVDEATRIKTPGSKRTKRVLASSAYAPYKRVLTGTPVTNSAFDVYTTMRFLEKDFWKKFGLGSFSAFKAYFGVFHDIQGPGNRPFRKLVGYRNLEQLQKIIATLSSRVTKDEVLDLPPKLYSRISFDLTPEQRRAYNQLRDQMLVELEDGAELEVTTALTMLLRFQQIACGYMPVSHTTEDPDSPTGVRVTWTTHNFPVNPRLEALKSYLEDVPHSAIIWARFTQDVNLICEHLGNRCVRYDGLTPGDEERAESKRRFQAGEVQFFVGKPSAAAYGLTLHKARSVIYYSNSFSLDHRLQSEDRAHRIGQTHPVQYVDLVAADTVDVRLISVLRDRKEISSLVVGDKLKEWI